MSNFQTTKSRRHNLVCTTQVHFHIFPESSVISSHLATWLRGNINKRNAKLLVYNFFFCLLLKVCVCETGLIQWSNSALSIFFSYLKKNYTMCVYYRNCVARLEKFLFHTERIYNHLVNGMPLSFLFSLKLTFKYWRFSTMQLQMHKVELNEFFFHTSIAIRHIHHFIYLHFYLAML